MAWTVRQSNNGISRCADLMGISNGAWTVYELVKWKDLHVDQIKEQDWSIWTMVIIGCLNNGQTIYFLDNGGCNVWIMGRIEWARMKCMDDLWKVAIGGSSKVQNQTSWTASGKMIQFPVIWGQICFISEVSY